MDPPGALGSGQSLDLIEKGIHPLRIATGFEKACEAGTCRSLGFRIFGFRVLGFRVQGFRAYTMRLWARTLDNPPPRPFWNRTLQCCWLYSKLQGATIITCCLQGFQERYNPEHPLATRDCCQVVSLGTPGSQGALQ